MRGYPATTNIAETQFNRENDIEIPESVAESVNEMFEIAGLTSASILGWFTRQKHRQLNSEKIEITVKYHHD